MTATDAAARRLAFVYHELWTSAPKERLPFYQELFGWEIHRESRADGEFLRIRHQGEEIARIVPLEESGDQPDRWNVFVSTPDLGALLARVTRSGGEVIVRELELPAIGRAGLVRDPLYGVFAAVERDRAPVQAAPEVAGAARTPLTEGEARPGFFCWHDLLTPDLDASSRFYQTALGLAARPHSPDTANVHRLLRSEGRDVAGLMAAQDVDQPALWLPYIAVESVVATVEAGEKQGAQVWLEPTEVEELGTFAVLSDPGRALLALRQIGSSADDGQNPSDGGRTTET